LSVASITLQAASNPNVSPLENIVGGLPQGSYIVGFLNEGTAAAPDWVATANSGAILEQDGPPTGVPGPTAGAGLPGLALAGFGLFIGWRRRRQSQA
jgi:MYXO-CTERM domain-containing protein